MGWLKDLWRKWFPEEDEFHKVATGKCCRVYRIKTDWSITTVSEPGWVWVLEENKTHERAYMTNGTRNITLDPHWVRETYMNDNDEDDEDDNDDTPKEPETPPETPAVKSPRDWVSSRKPITK